MKKLPLILLTAIVCLITSSSAWAIPAFARMYSYNCSMCHYPGYAQLNKFGYNFRAAGYRIPSDIGKDVNGGKFDLANYLAIRESAGVKATTTKNANGAPVPDNASFTLGGGSIYAAGAVGTNFFNYSEISLGNGTGVFPGSSPSLASEKLGYVTGSENDFWTFRIGKFSAQGFGASDSGPVGSASIVSSVKPTGTGAEVGYTHNDTRVTVAVWDGIQAPVYSDLDGSTTGATTDQTAPAADSNNAKDIQVVLNQFIGDDGLDLNAFFYNGFNGSLAYNGPTPTVANGAGTGDQPGQEYFASAFFLTVPVIKNLDLKTGVEYGVTNAGIFATTGQGIPTAGTFAEVDYAMDEITPLVFRWDSTTSNVNLANSDTEKFTLGAVTPFIQVVYMNPTVSLTRSNTSAGYNDAYAFSDSLYVFF